MTRNVQLPVVPGGEPRAISVFLPPGFTGGGMRHPIVYCADGEAVPALGSELAAAIDRGLVPPTILVGVHGSPAARAEEYLLGVDPLRFAVHEQFFVETVFNWVRSELDIATERADRAVFGFSNGGAFAVSIGLRHPEKFGQVIACSVAKTPEPLVPAAASGVELPRFYLATGRRGPEQMFRKNAVALAKTLRRRGAECVFAERDAGHDFTFWRQELITAISWAFGPPRTL